MRYQVRKFPGINEENGNQTMSPDDVARFLYAFGPDCQWPADMNKPGLYVEDLISKIKGYLPLPQFERLWTAYATKSLRSNPLLDPSWDFYRYIKPISKG